jgi:hypothetical protein
MARRVRALGLGMAVAAGLWAGSAWAAPVVTLTTQGPASVQVGDTFTVTVSASVTGGTANQGVVSYDLDLFPSDKTHLQLVGVAALQPPDSELSSGTVDAGTGGLLGISGVFDAPGVGIGAPVALFTAQFKALASGPASVAAGLSVYPNGTGHPFELNELGDYVPPPGASTFSVDTSHAIAAVNVTAVPEPSALAVALVAASVMWVRRRGGRCGV